MIQGPAALNLRLRLMLRVHVAPARDAADYVTVCIELGLDHDCEPPVVTIASQDPRGELPLLAVA